MRSPGITMSHRVVETISIPGRVISCVTSWNERPRQSYCLAGYFTGPDVPLNDSALRLKKGGKYQVHERDAIFRSVRAIGNRRIFNRGESRDRDS
jgi:hypothetical protein